MDRFIYNPLDTAEKNYNSGGVVAEETARDARMAHIQIYHDPEHESVLRVQGS